MLEVLFNGAIQYKSRKTSSMPSKLTIQNDAGSSIKGIGYATGYAAMHLSAGNRQEIATWWCCLRIFYGE